MVQPQAKLCSSGSCCWDLLLFGFRELACASTGGQGLLLGICVAEVYVSQGLDSIQHRRRPRVSIVPCYTSRGVEGSKLERFACFAKLLEILCSGFGLVDLQLGGGPPAPNGSYLRLGASCAVRQRSLLRIRLAR